MESCAVSAEPFEDLLAVDRPFRRIAEVLQYLGAEATDIKVVFGDEDDLPLGSGRQLRVEVDDGRLGQSARDLGQ